MTIKIQSDWRNHPDWPTYTFNVATGEAKNRHGRLLAKRFGAKDNYIRYQLHRPGVTKYKDGAKRSIHKIICEIVHGPAPFAGAQVRHLDGNNQNNHWSNLAWGTAKQNAADRKLNAKGLVAMP